MPDSIGLSKNINISYIVNGTIIAKGEVVMIGERFGIRFTEVVDPKERVQNL